AATHTRTRAGGTSTAGTCVESVAGRGGPARRQGAVAVSGPRKRIQPTANRRADNESLAGDSSSLPQSVEEWDTLAAQIDGAFAVIVRTTQGRYRRRVWLTLAPAERAAGKAREAGHDAVVVLAELKPLYRVDGGGDDD